MINSYYLMQNGEQTGPYTLYEIMDMQLSARTMLFSPISNDWQEMADLPEFNLYLSEKGVYLPTKANTASFWWRLLAYLLDYIVTMIIGAVLFSAFTLISILIGKPQLATELDDVEAKLLGIVLMIFYNAIFESSRLQGSIGKLVCRLSVVDANGNRLSFHQALGRNAGKILSSLILGLGFLNILWDRHRQGWHDQLAKTFVIRRQ